MVVVSTWRVNLVSSGPFCVKIWCCWFNKLNKKDIKLENKNIGSFSKLKFTLKKTEKNI